MENWDDKVKYHFWHCVFISSFDFGRENYKSGQKKKGRVSQRHVKMCWEWRKIDHNDIQNELNFELCSIFLSNKVFFICPNGYVVSSFDWDMGDVGN